MFYFDRWNVLEEPAHGKATLILWVGVDGIVLGPPYHDPASLYAGFDERKITFNITAAPWHKSGRRPFACDALIGPLKKGVTGVDPNYPEHYDVIVFAIAGDVILDSSDYNKKMGGRITRSGTIEGPYLDLKVIRVMDPSVLPDLGEPIYPPDLFPTEQWSVLDAIADDWSADKGRELPGDTFTLVTGEGGGKDVVLLQALPDGFWPHYVSYRDTLGDSLYDVIRISRRENGLDFESPADSLLSAGDKKNRSPLKWRVSLNWDTVDPALVLWQWHSPYRYKNRQDIPQSRLRLITSENVKKNLVYATFHDDKIVDKDGNTLDEADPENCIDHDPLRLEIQIAGKFDMHPADRFVDEDEFHVRFPRREFLRWQAQLSHDVGLTAQRDPFAILGLLTIPLLVIPSPAQPLALALSIALSFGSIYCAMAERAHVVKHGYDRQGQHRTVEEVESDLYWATAGLILSVAGPAIKGATGALSALRKVLGRAADLPTIIAAVRRPPTSLSLLLGLLDKRALERVARKALNPPRRVLIPDEVLLPGERSKDEIGLLIRSFHEEIVAPGLGGRVPKGLVPQQYLLPAIALERILKNDGSGFQIAALQGLFDDYLAGIGANFEVVESGINLTRAQGRLALDPLSWLLKGSGPLARKSKAMANLLGPNWREIVRQRRSMIPLPEDVLEIYHKFPPGALTYGQAQAIRNNLLPEHLKKISIYTEKFFHPRGAKLLDLVRSANKKSFGAMFELEHPFERRCIMVFRSPIDKLGTEVLDYVKEAKVLLVPKNRSVSQHIPDFDGYVHWEKSRRLEALIPYGKESEYTLQQMRDAHVFALSVLGGSHSPAIKMVDEAVALIAKRTDQSVEFMKATDPEFRLKFRPESWRYYPPSEEMKHAMRQEHYLFQRFQIEEAIEEYPVLESAKNMAQQKK